MKKALSILLVLLLMSAGTGFASMGEFKIEAQEIDFPSLLAMPGFTMQYSANNKPQWFSYEDFDGLVDERDCYVIPCITALQSGVGDFMVLQLDVGHYATPEIAIGVTAFSILVDETQYTFRKPQIMASSTEEYCMILCGQDALGMLKVVSSATSPVYIVLNGEKGSFAYEMTKVQQSVIKAIIEGGEKAGVFSSKTALDIAQAYTGATVSAISDENKQAAAEMEEGQHASAEGREASSQEAPQVDFSVFENIPGFTIESDEATGNFAVYSIDSHPLHTKEGYLVEPMISTVKGASGYAPVFFLSVVADMSAEFIICEAAFIVEGDRYTFSPTKMGNAELSNVFWITCGQTALRMLNTIFLSSDPVEIELTGESETVSFTMTSAQRAVMQKLYKVYMASGAATHGATLDVAEYLSPVAVKAKLAVTLPASTIKADSTAFENLQGPVIELDNGVIIENKSFIVHSAQDNKEHYTENGCFLEPVIVYDAEMQTLPNLFYALAVGEDLSDAPPETVTITVDGEQYTYKVEMTKGYLHLNYALIPCGEDEFAMIDTLLRSEKPVTVTMITKDRSIEFIVTEKQKELLKVYGEWTDEQLL